MLTEQLVLSLQYKKKLINEQISKLRNAFGKSFIEEECLFEAKKYFKKIDESLDKVSEDIFEMERSYQVLCPGNNALKNATKISVQKSQNFNSKTSKCLLSPTFKINRTSSENNVRQIAGMGLYQEFIKNTKEYDNRSIKDNNKYSKTNEMDKLFSFVNNRDLRNCIETPQEFSKVMASSHSKSVSKKSRTTKGSSLNALS